MEGTPVPWADRVRQNQLPRQLRARQCLTWTCYCSWPFWQTRSPRHRDLGGSPEAYHVLHPHMNVEDHNWDIHNREDSSHRRERSVMGANGKSAASTANKSTQGKDEHLQDARFQNEVDEGGDAADSPRMGEDEELRCRNYRKTLQVHRTEEQDLGTEPQCLALVGETGGYSESWKSDPSQKRILPPVGAEVALRHWLFWLEQGKGSTSHHRDERRRFSEP